MNYDQLIDHYVSCRNAKGFEPEPCENVPSQLRVSTTHEPGICLWQIININSAPWLGLIHGRFGDRVPLLFWSLYDRYSFLPFEIGPITVFQNAGTTSFNELACRFAQDVDLTKALAEFGYFRFAVMNGGSDQDFVCLDLNRREEQDCRVVAIDHEIYYLRDRIHVRHVLAPSLKALLDASQI